MGPGMGNAGPFCVTYSKSINIDASERTKVDKL